MRQNSGSNGSVDASTSFLPIPEREFVLPQSTHCTRRDARRRGAPFVTLNAVAGGWWADPLAGFVIVFYGLKDRDG